LAPALLRARAGFSAAVAAGVLLTGCVTSTGTPAVHTVQPPDGTYIHASFGMEFPQHVGAFERGDIDRYDTSGKDVSVGYVDATNFTVATIYVYPSHVLTLAGSPPDTQHFSEVKHDVESAHPTAALLADDGRVNIGDAVGRSATYELHEARGGVELALRSDVFLFGRGQWYVMYRFTYPEAVADQASTSIRTFMDALVWPE